MLNFGRRRFICAATGLGASLAYSVLGKHATVSTAVRQGQETYNRTSNALGTKVSITLLHNGQHQAAVALDAAFNAIEEVEAQLSIYRPDSQLCRLNRLGYLAKPHADLLAVLKCACDTSRLSHGAFDVTVQPLWELFASAQRLGRLPSSVEIAQARAYVNWQRVQVSPDKVQLLGHGTRVTLNGLAQGYAADRALSVIRRHGIVNALIDTGELASQGNNSGGAGWHVGIQHPRQPEAFITLTKLKDRCLSTSGDYATTFSSDLRFNHVFDPATGVSPNELACVTIAAPTAMQADAWSTASFVLGCKRTSELLRSLPDHDALFVLKDGRSLATPGFPLIDEGVAL